MRTIQRVAIWVYGGLLVAGGALGIWALWVAYLTYGEEPAGQTIRRGGAGLGAVLVSVVFAAILIVRGFRLVAPILFVVSYVLVASTLDFSLAGYMKAWAPATSVDAAHATLTAAVLEALVAACVLAAAWFSGRRATRLARHQE